MFEFLLSIRGSFLAVRVGRMPRRCAATVSSLKNSKYACVTIFHLEKIKKSIPCFHNSIKIASHGAIFYLKKQYGIGKK